VSFLGYGREGGCSNILVKAILSGLRSRSMVKTALNANVKHWSFSAALRLLCGFAAMGGVQTAVGLGVAPLSMPGATFVDSIDQAVSGKALRWTHRVAEAGDYQIGMAWLEVTSGVEVGLTIMAAGKVVKSLTARPGQAPQRFETRLVGLAAGDAITVTATPKGATYRLGYQIAFGTPSFPGAKIFHVKDFGAVGDGKTDDFAVIQKAVAAARKSGCGIVRFDGSKTYRAIGKTDFTEEPLFDLKGAKHLKIEGEGAMIVLHPPDSFALVNGAENIQIDGFKIDYQPKPYYQGVIQKIDVEAMTIDIEVPQRYPMPEIGKNEFWAPFFGRSFIPDEAGARSGHGDNIYVEEVTRLESGRRLRIHIREDAQNSGSAASMRPRVRNAAEHGATEFVVPHVKYGHRGYGTSITGSARVTLSNLHYFCVPHFWLPITHNIGPVTLRNVDLKTPHPETELFVSWRDGLHIKNGRWGILIEESDWDGAASYDDSFAIYSRAQKVVAVDGKKITITPTSGGKELFLWRKGDWASVWSPGQEKLRGMARVDGVDGKTGNHTFHVTLESMPVGAAKGDLVLHEESLNRGSVIRNCSTSDIGTENSSTRFRCVDLTFENNRFEDFHFWFHAGPNGPRPRDIILRNNYVSDEESAKVNFQQGLDCLLSGNNFDGVTLDFENSERMCLDGNRWTGMKEGQMRVKARTGTSVLLGGDNPMSKGDFKNWIETDKTSTVK
jgi:hypothetical protein